jgi:hypothetical protein
MYVELFYYWRFTFSLSVNSASILELRVSPGIEPGYSVFPSHKNNVYNLERRTAICVKEKRNF